MARRLDSSAPGFAGAFDALLNAKREEEEDVAAAVRGIIADVRARGDTAVLELTNKFDRAGVKAQTLRLTQAEIDAAEGECAKPALDALAIAARRIEVYHRRQIPKDEWFEDSTGAKLGWRWTPLDSVGLYVPGGTAAYPSSVLMNAVPARVAGVGRIVIVTPASGGVINPLVLAAAKRAGVSEIYRVGGAQAVAALAFGTKTISPVDKIVGPGNAYVAAAKRQVFGTVGIDLIAGPSEVLVIADSDNDPDWVASDLLAQAEHDAAAQAILVTDSSALADAVAVAVERQLKTLPRSSTAMASWRDFGAVIVVASLADAAGIANRVAPEHLELAVADPEALLPAIRNAGAVFLGRYTPEVIGDYVGGPNHVLPTARSARFSSGLSVLDFMKRTTLLKLGPEQLRALAPSAITLAEAEGLDAHARSVAIRLNQG